MSFIKRTPQKDGRGLFGSKVGNQDDSDSEYDTEPRSAPKHQKTPPTGNNDSDSAEQTSIFAKASIKKRRRQPPSGSEDELAAPAKKSSIFGFRPSKQTIPDSSSGGSNCDAEMREVSDEEERAGTHQKKSMRGIERPKRVHDAISAAFQDSTKAPLSPSDNLINSRLGKRKQKELEALGEQEKLKAEEEAALVRRNKDLEIRQADVKKRQEALNKRERDVSKIKGRIEGINLALGAQ